MTQLVGILNITPDSFSDGGLYLEPAKAVERAEQLFAEGAALVDIGAESTRPGAVPLSPEQEWARLEPVLGLLARRFEGRLSLDTQHAATVRRALAAGDFIINDVTGFNSPEMIKAVTAARPTPRVIICHLAGTDVQAAHAGQPVSTIETVRRDLLGKARQLEDAGVPRDKIILDPGIGFGKTAQLNRQLLEFAALVPKYPVMIGYSRKRFLGDERMYITPNLRAGQVAIAAGAAYLRVHDVAAHMQLVGAVDIL